MDNKGFTLIELLATVVVLGLVMGITAHSVLGVIEKSKDKSEKIFVDKLENSIDAYISDARTRKELQIDSKVNEISYTKCKLDDKDKCSKEKYTDDVTVVKMESFKLSKIKNLIQNKDIINPKSKKECVLGNVNVSLYRDSDMVYYYYADLSNLNCDVSEKYKIITNMPAALTEVIGKGNTSGSNNGSTDVSGSNNGSTDASGSNNGGTDASGSNNDKLTKVQNALKGKYYKKSSEIVLLINDVTSIDGNEITTNVTKYKINFTQVSKKISSSDKVIIAENKQTKKFCDGYEYNSNFQYYQLSRCNNISIENRKSYIYKLRTMLKDKYYCSDDTNSSKCRNFYKINDISYKNGKYYITSGANYYLESSVTSSLPYKRTFFLPITYYDTCSKSSSDYSAEYTCNNQNKYSNN